MSQNPYHVFAQVYDQDVHLEVPRAFFRTLRPLVLAHGAGPPILDLGCGSGLLTEALAATGARVIGLDGSRPMLALARKRCARFGKRVALVHARLERFQVAERAALALACHDVVNHLPSRSVLARVFARVQRALLPGGILVFDTVTEYCFERYWSDNTHLLEGPLGDVVMSCDWDADMQRATVRIISYVRAGRNRFARGETLLHEYFHAEADISRALVGAGFEQVWSRPWSPWRVQDAEAKRLRRLWCAVKPGPGGRPASKRSPAPGFRRLV
ncbi:MAG: class I SAM-dependent methyltransferase [Planctomycetes bacterium]|nr:class I SAM-dependent methyltransferase [Planctomycetota bacterium]